MRAIDADGHVQEPTGEIARFLPARLTDLAPRSATRPDALAGDLVDRITSRARLSESAKRKILRENARRCFGLP